MSTETLAQIQPILEKLSREEKQRLVDQLTHELRAAVPSERTEVAGMWKGKVPEDFDLDAALQEIRHEWLKEIDGMETGEIP